MENTSNGIILFRIEVNRSNGGFAQASNFLTKIIGKEEIYSSDVRGITSKIFRESACAVSYDAKANALVENMDFLPINKPHKILEVIENRDHMFGLCIDDEYLEDTISILPFVLMKLFFQSQKVFAVIQGVKKHFYPMQLLLHNILEKRFFVNSVYYYMLDIKKLQLVTKRKQVKIRAFYPIQIVNRHTFGFLNARLKDVFHDNGQMDGEQLLINCLEGNTDLYKKAPEQLRDICYVLCERRKFFDNLDKKKITNIFLNGNTLSFILYIFLIQSKSQENRKSNGNSKEKKIENLDDIKVDYNYVMEYALGILQLLENIVFHAETHSGVFAMRLYNTEKDDYLKSKFPEKRESSYLEILIADYKGSNHCDNIATRFVKNLPLGERSLFHSLTPWDMFAYGDSREYISCEVKKSFQKYYENYENLGRHYGLKVFRNMIIKNEGAFHFYSCTDHDAKEGEYGGIDSSRKKYETFPGTGYDILLPAIGKKKSLSVATVDNYNEYEDFGVHIKEYKPFMFTFDTKQNISYCFQEEKEQKVEELAALFQKEIRKNTRKVAKEENVHLIGYYSVDNLKDEQAELILKSLLRVALRMKVPDIVLYDCSDVFVNSFRRNVDTFFGKIGIEDVYADNPFCIALYAQDGEEEALIFPSSKGNTYRANMPTGYSDKKEWMKDWEFSDSNLIPNERYEKIPYDVLMELPYPDGKNTIYERYVKTILDKDIQQVGDGCQLKDTHMRLGSMIHVSSFYEAEILFHNRYFVSRFAFQIALKLHQDLEIDRISKLTICAYGMYSEMLVNQLIQILSPMLGKAEGEIDYAILEKEMNEDTWVHNDKFRYSAVFKNRAVQKLHFQERHIITIVPINSTLKTQDKLIEIFCTENGIEHNNNFCANFSLILVGASKENEYWKINTKEKKCYPRSNFTGVTPAPVYFVNISMPYFETNCCSMCFPDTPIDEKPLIEVNEYSTVPNQSIGLISNPKIRYTSEMYQRIFWEQKEYLEPLDSSLVYTHIRRKSNHFLYYFDTEKFFLENKHSIEQWLINISKKIQRETLFSVNHFHVLFCPAHYSNANFIDSVSRCVFHEAVLVVRIDIEKEYRENVETKNSYLGLLIQQLGKNKNIKYTIHTHFIDDCIITGKTYQRMYSLARSIFEKYFKNFSNIKVYVFDRIFVLIDRNSNKTKLQYVVEDCIEDYGVETVKLEEKYFAFKNLRISSIRNHGDSCIICQLAKESETLSKTSATKKIMDYWVKRAKSFRPMTVAEYQDELEKKYDGSNEEQIFYNKRKNFRRMYCYHVSNIFLTEETHGNQKRYALREIFHLLLESMKFYQHDLTENLEYVLSYLKVISRPFLVYHKEIKEAIFQLLLLLSDWLIGNHKNGYFAATLCGKDISQEERDTLLDFEKELSGLLDKEEHKRDFLLVCMKQLMELKSNFFIRKESMKSLTSFIKDWNEDNKALVNQRYLYYVKKLVGVGNDTQKSIWLEQELQNIVKSEEPKKYLQKDILRTLILENIRAYYNGVELLSEDNNINSDTDIITRIENIKYKDFKQYVEKEKLQYQIIWSSISFFRFLKDFNSGESGYDKLREKYYELANYAYNILEAKKVYILIEDTLECECWKKEFAERMQNIVDGLDFKNIPTSIEFLRHEYLIVSASNEKQTLLDVPISVTQNIENANMSNQDEYFNYSAGYFIWRIGDSSIYPIIVYAEFEHGCNDSFEKYRQLCKCRRLLMMHNKLRNSVCSDSVISYLHDIVKAENNAIRLSFFKSVSHTPEDIRKQQYRDLVTQDREQYYQSHNVTLLSDLKISETYRRSLERDYYLGNLKIKFKEFLNVDSMLSRMHNYYVIDGMTQKHIKIDIISNELAVIKGEKVIKDDLLISDEQKIAFNDYANGMDEIMLLLMALIENAATKGKTENIGGQDCVKVFLSKTKNGKLRILNEVLMKPELEKVNFYLKRPPQPKDGISIWSISRYLLSIGCILVNKVLLHYEQMVENKNNSIDSEERIKYCMQKIIDFIKYDLEVKVDSIEKKGCFFFSIELPVFADTYQNFLNCMEE